MPAHRERQRTPEPHRPRRIAVYLTEEEHAALLERAGRYTHGSVSAYLREAGLHRRMDPLPPPPPAINQEAYLAFTRIGGLLNQAMHHLNAGNIWTEPRQLVAFRQQLADLDTAIQEVRRLLTRAT
jgi:hypothetical protein